AAGAGDLDRAEALARTITGPGGQMRALAKLTIAAARAGDANRSARLASDAEALAGTLTGFGDEARALAELATAAAQAGDAARARRLLALANTVETPGILWLVETVPRLFPSVIRNACDVFLSAYKAEALSPVAQARDIHG